MAESIAKKNAHRDSSMELLRIIAMVMIIFHHFAVHGGFEWSTEIITIPQQWYSLLRMGGKVGVDLFVLISGYYLCTNEQKLFNFKRILKFWGPLFFYSICFTIIFKLFGSEHIGNGVLIMSFFPVIFSKWWFATIYLMLYLLHPFINKLLNAIDRQTYRDLLVLMVICWSIIPTFSSTTLGGQMLWEQAILHGL